MDYSLQEEVLVEVLEDITEIDLRDLVIYNDDFNTFDHVIATLIKVCNHTAEQAEQCAYIIHYKGKCIVKRATLNKLKPMKEAICEAGIDARIH
ncbi:MAG: ATP-dependent Clp protease adaptor ClpS [Cyclobacteriaceae bacterium]|nr:ATP-dependent Clp protease adaptor ClpS [Cyclobacteriaceae bacterium]